MGQITTVGIDLAKSVFSLRVRHGFVVERTAIINRLRGLMSEFGVVLPLRSITVRRQAAAAAESLHEHSDAVRPSFAITASIAEAGKSLRSRSGAR